MLRIHSENLILKVHSSISFVVFGYIIRKVRIQTTSNRIVYGVAEVCWVPWVLWLLVRVNMMSPYNPLNGNSEQNSEQKADVPWCTLYWKCNLWAEMRLFNFGIRNGDLPVELDASGLLNCSSFCRPTPTWWWDWHGDLRRAERCVALSSFVVIWNFMELNRTACDCMGLHGIARNCIELHRTAWNCVELYESDSLNQHGIGSNDVD